MKEALPIFIGYDPREAAAYHVCCQSIIETATQPVAIYPLARSLLGWFDGQRDGSNQFIFSRFLVPYVSKWRGWALFIDGDMIVRGDVSELFDMRDEYKAAMLVKHDYRTKEKTKYVGSGIESVNSDYPRKNWSSVVLWNCAHFANRKLTPSFIAESDTATMHRFGWLEDELIGDLPAEWNWLDVEYGHNPDAKLIHYTLGVPGFKFYSNTEHSRPWHETFLRTVHVESEFPIDVVARAQKAT